MKTENDCSRCKFCEMDWILDKDTFEAYPLYTCKNGNDTDLDYECCDFKENKS